MSLTAQQKIERSSGVGCSEILAALGKDERCSRVELYRRKIGELPDPDFSDNERVECGDVLEPSIRALFERKLGVSIVKLPGTLRHPTAPLVGHPDGIVTAEPIGPDANPARIKTLFADEPGIEFKNRDWLVFHGHESEYGEDWTDQVPLRDLVQCVGYMTLADKRRWLLGALVGGNERHVFEIHYDEDLVAAILAGVAEFWGHVETLTPPDPSTPEEVKLRWPKDLGTDIAATDEIVEATIEHARLKVRLKALEQEEAATKARIQKFMAENALLTGPDGKLLATWKTARDSDKFDVKAFAEDHPQMHERYLKPTPGSRRFLNKLKAEIHDD
jgi:predicted phage-related endonuclease